MPGGGPPAQWVKPWPQDYKPFFMLNSAEHEILNAHKNKKYKEISAFFRLR